MKLSVSPTSIQRAVYPEEDYEQENEGHNSAQQCLSTAVRETIKHEFDGHRFAHIEEVFADFEERVQNSNISAQEKRNIRPAGRSALSKYWGGAEARRFRGLDTGLWLRRAVLPIEGTRVTLEGRIDLIAHDPENKETSIIDFRVSNQASVLSSPWTLQAAAYMYLFLWHFNKWPDNVIFWSLGDNAQHTVTPGEIQFDANLFDMAVKAAEQRLTELKKREGEHTMQNMFPREEPPALMHTPRLTTAGEVRNWVRRFHRRTRQLPGTEATKSSSASLF